MFRLQAGEKWGFLRERGRAGPVEAPTKIGERDRGRNFFERRGEPLVEKENRGIQGERPEGTQRGRPVFTGGACQAFQQKNEVEVVNGGGDWTAKSFPMRERRTSGSGAGTSARVERRPLSNKNLPIKTSQGGSGVREAE